MSPSAFANLDWLPRGAVVLTNLLPGADGVLRVPLTELGDGQLVQVLALDNEQAVRRTVVRPAAAIAPRSRALARSRIMTRGAGLVFPLPPASSAWRPKKSW